MNREKLLQRKRKYRERHREEIRAKDRMYYAQNKWKFHLRALFRDARMAADEKFYCAFRAKQREYLKRHRDKARKREYRPIRSMRFPDWACKGVSTLDVRSQWLINNMTDEQRAYARELAIERKEQAERMGRR